MCLAFPGKVIEIEDKKVLVEYPRETRTALLADEPVKVGDYVMVQMGIVIKVVSEDEARLSYEAWEK
jgi:hydrogenase expression/formation protein HypC